MGAVPVSDSRTPSRTVPPVSPSPRVGNTRAPSASPFPEVLPINCWRSFGFSDGHVHGGFADDVGGRRRRSADSEHDHDTLVSDAAAAPVAGVLREVRVHQLDERGGPSSTTSLMSSTSTGTTTTATTLTAATTTAATSTSASMSTSASTSTSTSTSAGTGSVVSPSATPRPANITSNCACDLQGIRLAAPSPDQEFVDEANITDPFKDRIDCGTLPWLHVFWLIPPPERMFVGEDVRLRYSVWADPCQGPLFGDGVGHTVIHACQAGVGACEPDVTTDGLVTPTTPLIQDWRDKCNQTITIDMDMVLNQESVYDMIIHVALVNSANNIQYDISVGLPYSVEVVQRLKTISAADPDNSDSAAFWVVYAAAILAGLWLILLFCAVLVCMRHVVIRASTVSFSLLILVCMFLMLVALVPLGVTPSDASCALQPWFLFLPPMFAVSLVFTKTFRVYWLLGRKRTGLKRVIGDFWLLVLSLLPMILPVIYLIVWTAVPPSMGGRLAPNKVRDTDEEVKWAQCGHAHWAWFIPPFLYLGLFVLATMVLAFLTRRVTTLFHESRYITASVYVTLVWGLAGVMLYALLDAPASPQPDAKFQIAGWFIVTAVFMLSALLYVPKFLTILFHSRNEFLPLAGDKPTGFGNTSDATSSTGRRRRRRGGGSSKAGSVRSGSSGSKRTGTALGTLQAGELNMNILDDEDDMSSDDEQKLDMPELDEADDNQEFWMPDGAISFDVLDVFVNSRAMLQEVLDKQSDGFRLAPHDVQAAGGAVHNLRDVLKRVADA